MDTRKTLPGLRIAQKYAVKVGGGHNQRIGLFDGILIKENHIAAAGGIRPVLTAAQQLAGQDATIQIEVENLDELHEALEAGARLVLLDNFSLTDMRAAVSLNAGRAELEASGGVNLQTVHDIAKTGVDRISIGGLTKDVQAWICRCGLLDPITLSPSPSPACGRGWPQGRERARSTPCASCSE